MVTSDIRPLATALMTMTVKVIDAEHNQISHLSLTAAGSDILAVLDHNQVLQTLDSRLIESEMNDLLSHNHDMMIKIVVDDGTVLYSGDSFPEEQFMATGIRYFTINDYGSIKFAYASYSIWTK